MRPQRSFLKRNGTPGDMQDALAVHLGMIRRSIEGTPLVIMHRSLNFTAHAICRIATSQRIYTSLLLAAAPPSRFPHVSLSGTAQFSLLSQQRSGGKCLQLSVPAPPSRFSHVSLSGTAQFSLLPQQRSGGKCLQLSVPAPPLRIACLPCLSPFSYLSPYNHQLTLRTQRLEVEIPHSHRRQR